MGLFEKKIKQIEAESDTSEIKNFAKVTADKAVDIIKELSGKQIETGKKIIDNVIAFSSTAGGGGASTVASNFAYFATRYGLSVVIVDLNILCPIQHTYLGIDQELKKSDLVSYLNGESPLNESIEVGQGINVMFANNRTLNDLVNCSSKMAIDNFNQMIHYLRNYYDLVILDCPMRIDDMLCNTALYTCDSLYVVWDEGTGSIINTEKLRRNMALSGIDCYTKMHIILNKRTSVHFSDYALKKLNLELIGVLPFTIDIIDNSLRGRIFCDKGAATGKNGAEFSRKMDMISDKILKIAGYSGVKESSNA